MTDTPLPSIGWREYIGLPEWGLPRLRAKIDTGANTSTVDAFDIRELPDGMVEFQVVKSRRPTLESVPVRAMLVRRTIVRSSTGDGEERCVVRTLAKVGEHEFSVELTLDARPRLLCRMLLGRRALAGRFLVDCGHRYILTTPPKRHLKVSTGSPPRRRGHGG